MPDPESQALTKRSSDSALMPPPPPPKRQKRPAKVLDEDVYSEALSHIIARDFFPGLLETEAQTEYINALDSNDNDWIREAGRKLTQTMTPLREGQRRGGRGTSFTPARREVISETPRSFAGETPTRTPVNDDFAPEERQEVDVNMSLGAFQAKYTSEDNESFNALLDKQNEKRAAKYGFFHHGNKIPSARQIAHRARERKLLESGHSQALVTTNAVGDERQSFAGNRPSEDLDMRSASVDSFPNRQGPRNTFMFGPEGVVEARALVQSNGTETPSNGPIQAVHYAATRFSTLQAQPENAVPASPSMSAIDAAIAGRPRASESDNGYSGAETPRVNGYAFVDAEPTPRELGVAVSDEEADAAEREAATQLLPAVDATGPNPFTISERSKREEVLFRLVEKADTDRRKGGRVEHLRALGITPGRTPTPKFSSSVNMRKSGAMTPAAQKLANSIGTPRREGGIFGSASTQKSSWTPTPRHKKQAGP